MWHTQSARVTGRGHLRKGLPCQDRTWIMGANGVTAIALADGAGSAQWSQEGAAVAVRQVCELLCAEFDSLFRAPSPVLARKVILEEVRGAIRDRAEQLGVRSRELACTLLAVAMRGDTYLVFHVGDGVIGYQRAGKLLVASAPRNGEFANTTTFVTSADALRASRILKGSNPDLEGFVLMSDGCEAALYHKRKQKLAPLMTKLFQRAELLGRESAQGQLEAVLDQIIARRTQDDCSLALMVRPGRRFGRWERMTQREKAAMLGILTENQNRRRRAIQRYAKLYGVYDA